MERRKLDFKARKCLLLGYGANQKGYRLYDLERMKVIHSKDVIFDETSMPGIQKEKDTTVNYVELKIEAGPGIEEIATPDSVPEETSAHQQINVQSG